MFMNVKVIRTKMGLSRKDFAAHFGVPVRTLEEWEVGRRVPAEYIPKMMEMILDLEEKVRKLEEENE